MKKIITPEQVKESIEKSFKTSVLPLWKKWDKQIRVIKGKSRRKIQ